MDDTLAVADLRVRFGKFLAVRDVSFSLAAGNLLGLVGPNGAGKTTLLRAIAGLQTFSRGSIAILGNKLSDDSRQWIGFTPDVPPVYDALTVRQFLLFVGKGYALSARETAERTDFWLEKLWLKEKAANKIKDLSRGMKQRIGIARTMIPNPAIVILDEPAAGLDPAGRVQFRQLLMDLREQGKTLIVSSHILADMGEYCSHIGIMGAGVMRKFGTVSDVVHGHDSQRCRYVIQLARAIPTIDELLSGVADLADVQIERDRVTLSYRSEKEAAAELLALLISQNVPIASFAPVTANVEEAYMRIGAGQVD